MFEIMQQLQDYFAIALKHVVAHQIYYGLALVVGGPILFFTRKWSVPFILYCIEITIYLCIMHVFVNVLLQAAGWFRNASSMKMLRPDGQPEDAVDWHTPLINFWIKTDYNPQWVIYLEGVLVCIIIALVLRFRTFTTQKPKPRFNADGSRVNKDDKDGTGVASKYGRQRYADEWAKEAARSSRDTRMRRQSGNDKER